MVAKDTKIERLAKRLADARSRRVVLVSHCLLNQNVRYLGGAKCAGVVAAAVDPFIRDGIGLLQMPCPEQVAWGGVLKRYILRFYGSERTLTYRMRRVLFPVFRLYTRWRYRSIARRVVDQIADYTRSGYEIVGIVGVGDSPSCGVTHTLDLERALPVIAGIDLDTIDPPTFTERAVQACMVEGKGLYVAALQRELTRRKMNVAFLEY
ncbi:MAG: hypothetical protein WAT25_04315 [Paracoccaceae bacterium]|jgi:uncharacterized protein YbbK (DUF523 family)|nr:DUF523 domain-containing protein [Rhodobacter sp.]